MGDLSSRLEKTKEHLNVLEDEPREVRLGIDNIFQSLMSSMSIAKSKKAIEQAEGVNKLTQLAFFFIPLSLVASVVGMNVIIRGSFSHHDGAVNY